MNLGDHRTALLDDLSVESTDTFYTTAILNRFINRAVRAISNLFNWQQTRRAQYLDVTLAGDATDEYWDIPTNFKTNSINKVYYNGEEYDPLTWEEYLKFKLDNPNNTTERRFSEYRRRVFLNPIPTTAAELLVWGHEIPDNMSSDSDTHPFADEQTLEEAINEYALGLTLRKGRGSHYERGKQLMADAYTKATIAFDRQTDELATYETEQAEMFEHTDFLPEGAERPTKRGSFNTC